MFRSILIAGVMTGVAFTANAQNDLWTQHGDWITSEIESCKDTVDDVSICNDFAGRALDRLLGVSEFCRDTRCILMADIEAEMRNNPDKWQLVGGASDQAVLDKARELADAGSVVVAAQSEEGRGQIAILVPGRPVASGKWGMDRVPLAAASRSDAPGRSVYGEGINWVFSDPSRVTIYNRR
jgi:hypothetical protein